MSSQFKLLVAGCLRKNPENRLGLEGIKEHVWWKRFGKKFTKPVEVISVSKEVSSTCNSFMSNTNIPSVGM